MSKSLDSQIDRLAKFITEEVPGEPSQSLGAVDTAIRIIREQPAHDRRVKAETLAELIEAMEAMSLPTQVPPHLSQDWFTGYENADREFTDWLRRRLAAIENGADDEPR